MSEDTERLPTRWEFPKGNEMWKMRSKSGRPMKFDNPQEMIDAACEYFRWCDDNPLISIDFKGKDAVKVEIPKMRAYTLTGLCLFMGVNDRYWHHFKARCLSAEDSEETMKAFLPVMEHIESIIFEQKFTGAAADMLNPQIISKDLGLTDKIDLNHKGEIKRVWGEKPEDAE